MEILGMILITATGTVAIIYGGLRLRRYTDRKYLESKSKNNKP
jgi:hypothetical protein